MPINGLLYVYVLVSLLQDGPPRNSAIIQTIEEAHLWEGRVVGDFLWQPLPYLSTTKDCRL